MIIYEERAPVGAFVKYVMLAAILFLIGSVTVIPYEEDGARIVIVIVLLVVIYATWAFFTIRFRLTDSYIEAMFTPIRFRVKYDDITKVELLENIPWYAGFGLRIMGRTLAFISRRGKAVKIERKSGFFKGLILTTRNPDTFVQKVKEQTK